jgi:hypothetical protein
MRSMLPALSAALCISLAGCGRGPITRVTGQVTLDGKPLDGAQVQFVQKSDPALGYASAITNAAGAFTIEPDARNNNLLRPGLFVVLVSKDVPQNASGEMGTPLLHLVPAIYGIQAQTPLSAEIKEGDNPLPPLEVRGEKKARGP